MGLAERRGVKDFETKHLAAWQQKVEGAAKMSVPVEVKWETLALDGESHLYEECWPKVYFQPLIAALESITRDDLGKDALTATLKKIIVQNTADVSYGDRWATFEGGVLTLDHKPTTNVDSVKERTDGLVALLEKSL